MSKKIPLEQFVGSDVGVWKILQHIGWNQVGPRKYGIFRVKCLKCGTEYIKASQQLKYGSKWCKACIAVNRKQVFSKTATRDWEPDRDAFLCSPAPSLKVGLLADPSVGQLERLHYGYVLGKENRREMIMQTKERDRKKDPSTRRGYYHMTYAEIGKEMGMTPQQAKKMVNEIMFRLKESAVDQNLNSKDYLED